VGQAEAGALDGFYEDRYAPDGRLYLSLSLIKGLLTDATRLVPELAPLAAPVIAVEEVALGSPMGNAQIAARKEPRP